ncbi:MAG: hypothetical protein JSV26_02260 [bacterium]|nr:MAG: hypothetical protein JSV26_02260 [bacterium]
MHHPKYLLALKTRAEKALNQDPPDGLTAFTAAWALWEAVRKRLLVLACKREGWTVEQAREALPSEAINQKNFLKLYTAVTGGGTWEESMPMAAGALWPEILEAMEVRLRIINGSSRIGEDSLQRHAWSILRFINRLREHRLGDPLKELPKRSRKTLSDESLEKRLKTAQ